jgi:ribosomal protein L37AE/L43A
VSQAPILCDQCGSADVVRTLGVVPYVCNDCGGHPKPVRLQACPDCGSLYFYRSVSRLFECAACHRWRLFADAKA